MGRSVTCTFAVHVNFSDGTKLLATQSCYGAMNWKQVKGILLSEHDYQTGQALKNLGNPEYARKLPVNAEVWPQTAKGRNMVKGDYALVDLKGNITHHEIQKAMFQVID